MPFVVAALCNRCRTHNVVCMSVELGTLVCYTKTAEPIEMSFGVQTCAHGPGNSVLDGAHIPQENGTFERGACAGLL